MPRLWWRLWCRCGGGVEMMRGVAVMGVAVVEGDSGEGGFSGGCWWSRVTSVAAGLCHDGCDDDGGREVGCDGRW
ncbi:hypothetical protein Tco_0251230 [Tanacetum coccineum]